MKIAVGNTYLVENRSPEFVDMRWTFHIVAAFSRDGAPFFLGIKNNTKPGTIHTIVFSEDGVEVRGIFDRPFRIYARSRVKPSAVILDTK